MAMIPVRSPDDNKLLFRFDPLENKIEIQQRNKKYVIDLSSVTVAPASYNEPVQQLVECIKAIALQAVHEHLNYVLSDVTSSHTA